MALTYDGTKTDDLNINLKPTGYTDPTVTTFDEDEATWSQITTLEVAKATVENATKATTLTNIVTDETVGITKQVTDLLTAQFDSGLTGNAHASVLNIVTNLSPNVSSDFFSNVAAKYVVRVKILAKVTS